jgi:hypothetical protein
MRIGLEGDWLDRFGGLLDENGRWAERQMRPTDTPTLGNPERLLDHAIELPNAVCRFHSVAATWTRCLILTFRYTAISDEKREGLAWLGFMGWPAPPAGPGNLRFGHSQREERTDEHSHPRGSISVRRCAAWPGSMRPDASL